LYHHGWGLEQNYTQALYWYRQAAQHRLAAGENSVGVMYLDGLGVEVDYRAAASWFEAAAEHGDRAGQFDLASLYSLGRGVPLDYVRAYFWYSLAATQGDERSAHHLKQLAKLMTPRQISEARTRLSERLAEKQVADSEPNYGSNPTFAPQDLK